MPPSIWIGYPRCCPNDFQAEETSDGRTGLDFNWDKSPVHTAAIGLKLPANHKIQAIKNKLQSSYLSMADFILLPRGKYLPYIHRLT